MKNQQGGFTLIEIAIVLVIIGLILGGVLKGQELITSAKIRNVANDFNGISAAYYSYQDRYRAMPGDDPNAASRWTTSKSGDGNAVINGKFDDTVTGDPTSTQESNLFWQHLRLAGLVAGPTSGAGSGNQPQNAVGGITGVQSGPALGLNGLVICSTNLPGKVANAIDSQFDDGKPNSGQVRAVPQPNAGALQTTTPANSPDAYVDDGSTLYVVCKNM